MLTNVLTHSKVNVQPCQRGPVHFRRWSSAYVKSPAAEVKGNFQC
ncbi:MAG: hypothetical protein ACTS44_01605 [Candidatus Hodgkinia cicadicola]